MEELSKQLEKIDVKSLQEENARCHLAMLATLVHYLHHCRIAHAASKMLKLLNHIAQTTIRNSFSWCLLKTSSDNSASSTRTENPFF